MYNRYKYTTYLHFHFLTQKLKQHQDHKDIALEIRHKDHRTSSYTKYCTQFHKTVSLEVDLTIEIVM